MDHLRYPIGRYTLPTTSSTAQRDAFTRAIGDFPALFSAAARDLRSRQLLDRTYRPGGWTARQVIHHVADSHVNAYVRHRKALTEDRPAITPYEEQHWAELADV